MKLSIISLLAVTAANLVSAAYHFYTTNQTGESAPQMGYHYEEIAAYTPPASTSGVVTVYRFYNTNSGAYFWTIDPAGEYAPQLGYHSQGPAFSIFNIKSPAPAATVPWYRWATNVDHFYSTDYNEGTNAGFSYEGEMGYVYAGNVELSTLRLYRWYNG